MTTVYPLYTDHLGTPRTMTSPSGSVVWRWNPYASSFGENAPDDGKGNTPSVPLNLRFPGQYFDAESGLYYNYYRDYEAGTGRYVESDPVGLKGGISTYGYVNGNPLSYADPFGLFCTSTRFPISPWMALGPPQLLYREAWRLVANQDQGPEEGARGALGLVNALTQQLKCGWNRFVWYKQNYRMTYMNFQICIGKDCDRKISYKNFVDYEYDSKRYFEVEPKDTNILIPLYELDYEAACNRAQPPPGP